MVKRLDYWINSPFSKGGMGDFFLDYWIIGLMDCWINNHFAYAVPFFTFCRHGLVNLLKCQIYGKSNFLIVLPLNSTASIIE